MLRVIDAASYQGDMNQGEMDFDALIVKATEGVNYVNPYCDSEFQEAYSLEKKMGVYHFARNTKNSAQAEAEFFIKNTQGYIGKAIPVLDWEDSDTSNISWALTWLKLVEKAYGCKPLLYTSESVVNAYDWSPVANADYGIWCAKYADYIPDYNFNMAGAGPAPSIKWWKTMALWQWTSVGRIDGHNGNLDCSIFYGDSDAWDKYVGTCKGNSGTTEQSPVVETPIVKDPTKDIIAAGQVHSDNFAGTGIKADGERGPQTKIAGVKVLQQGMNLDYDAGLKLDGEFGSKSNAALGKHTVRLGETQYMVTALEILLMLKGYDPKGVESPGVFGSGLDACVRRYQGDHGLTMDGIAGRNTFISLIS